MEWALDAAGWAKLLALVAVGALASGINSVAGGGSLLSFPALTLGLGIPERTANATNSTGLWPGSLAGAFGFLNLLPKTAKYLKVLFLPTLTGCSVGAWLLLASGERVFRAVVPGLLLFAALLLWFQPHIKAYVERRGHTVSSLGALVLQFVVSVYGGYFGAGMGIMMLAVFALYMEGNIHEINAAKNWLGLIINLVASTIFIWQGLVLLEPALALAIGSILGGFAAARVSQRIDPDKMRVAIACYGLVTAAYFAFKTWS